MILSKKKAPIFKKYKVGWPIIHHVFLYYCFEIAIIKKIRKL